MGGGGKGGGGWKKNPTTQQTCRPKQTHSSDLVFDFQ